MLNVYSIKTTKRISVFKIYQKHVQLVMPLKQFFRSFAFKAQLFYNSLTLCMARADLSVSVN